jgi:hypothetical protein
LAKLLTEFFEGLTLRGTFDHKFPTRLFGILVFGTAPDGIDTFFVVVAEI